MATGYHLSANPVSRGKGQSVIAKAAYNSREKLREERTGELKDYTQKKDRPLWSGIFAPQNAPAWAQDRQQLWNRADTSPRDKRKDAQIAYNVIAALPHQLTQQQREYIVKDFIREQFLRRGVAADGHIHAPDAKGDDRNYHVHILATMRELTPDGFGERVLTWDDRFENLGRWREKWAERCARELEKAGHTVEADRWREGHRTLEQQRRAALERGDAAYVETLKHREATKHRGPAVDAMERKGQQTDRGNIHRDTVAANNSRAINAALKLELATIQKAIAQEERDWTDQLHKAAIEKEKIERRFVEPPPARAEPQRGTLAGGPQAKERSPFVPAAPPARPTPAAPAGAIRQQREAERHTEQRTLRREVQAQVPERAAPGRAINRRDTATPTPNLAKAAKRTIGGAIGALGKLADGFSLDGLTPKEKHEAAKLRHANERQADEEFDSMANIAARAKARQQEQEREEEQRQRQQRDRDRDRR